MGEGPLHGVWWVLMAWVGCRLAGALGQIGGSVVIVAGLSSETLVLDSVFGQGLPLPSLLGGGVVVVATLLVQALLLCGLAWVARPVRWSTMLAGTVLGGLALLIVPVISGGTTMGSTVGMSQLGTTQLAAYSMTTSLLGVLQLVAGPLPLLAALITVTARARPAG